MIDAAANRPRPVRAAALSELPSGSRMTVQLDGHVIALFHTCLLYTSPSPRD